jgi:hypothetical protein
MGSHGRTANHQFLAVVTDEEEGYFVLVGCRHPMASSQEPSTLLVICDRNAPDLSEKNQKIATEMFNLLIESTDTGDGVGLIVERFNFDYVPNKIQEYFGIMMVPQVRKHMEFKFSYNFSCCFGTVASIFLNNLVDTASVPLRKRIEKSFEHTMRM